MRLADLGTTWTGLEEWFDNANVLVLPIFHGGEPLVRLDDDLDTSRDATPSEIERVLSRLFAVIERFEIKAVYVRHTGWDADNDWAAGRANGRWMLTQAQQQLRTRAERDAAPAGPPTRVTVRVLAGGVVHELLLVAGWHAALEAGAAEMNASMS